jgi:hypothetical protein
MDWYSVADTKGQLLLTLNGIYEHYSKPLIVARSGYSPAT